MIYKKMKDAVDSRYYRLYKEQLEFFHLINNRGHLFFGKMAC